jgi:hypothetical protein
MTSFTWSRLRSEDGMAAALAVIVLGIMLTLAAAVFAQSVFLSDSTNKDDMSKRAFQAANAGLDVALARLNLIAPEASKCITTTSQVPGANGWCSATAWESVGDNADFSYQVSTAPIPGGSCAGQQLLASERCVVSTGRALTAQRRVEARVGALAGDMPIFYTTCLNPASPTVDTCSGIVGDREVNIKDDAIVNGGFGTNGRIKFKCSATVNGPVQLGPAIGKLPGCLLGNILRRTAPFLVARPDFRNPYTLINSATSNDNAMINTFPRSQTSKIPYDPVKRKLTLADGQSLTLSSGVYNLCSMTIGKNARLSIAPGARVILFLDMPEGTGASNRQGSGCPNDAGTFESKENSAIQTTTTDPADLQIYAWGSTKHLAKGQTHHTVELPLNSEYHAAIVAPYSKVTFEKFKRPNANSPQGTLNGGIIGRKVEIRKDMHFNASEVLLTQGSTDVDLLSTYARFAWTECRARNSSSNPDFGCNAVR